MRHSLVGYVAGVTCVMLHEGNSDQSWVSLPRTDQNDQKFHFKCVRLDLAQHLSAQLPVYTIHFRCHRFQSISKPMQAKLSPLEILNPDSTFTFSLRGPKGHTFTRPSATLPASPSTSNLPSSSRSYDLRLAMLRRKSPGKSKISMDRASGNECYSSLVQLMRITESLLNFDWHPCNTKAEQNLLYLLLPTLFNAV